jgi:hypothetical protein
MSHQTNPDANDDILPEYDFSQGVRGKHYQAYKAGTNVVFLDPDVARAFADSVSVNQALRLLVKLAKEKVPVQRRPNKRIQRTSARASTKRARARR